MTDDELLHLRRLRATIRTRQKELEEQAAMYGPRRVPAEIAIEIREADESIKRLDAKLLQVSVPQEVQEATGPESSIDVLRHEVRKLADQHNAAMLWMNSTLMDFQNESRDYRDRQETKHDAGALRYQRGFVVLGVLNAITLILIALIIGRVFW
jgi:hypothetical protein